jgi:DNA-binding transcriptional LysR family regulator
MQEGWPHPAPSRRLASSADGAKSARTVNLPTVLLRSFVAIVDAGSMLNAAKRVFVTQSALSLQIKRLEELVLQSLFRRDGRRLVLTPSGEILLDYARRVLTLHDEAIAAVNGRRNMDPVRVGTVQDFADTLLSGLLSRFVDLYPENRIYARVASSAELIALMERGELDVIIGYSSTDDPQAVKIADMSWFGDGTLLDQEVVPLAVLEQPCRFREAAITSLEAEGRPWRIAVETPNLAGLRAAVSAGLAVTCRTHLFLPEADMLDAETLPQLPGIACFVSSKSGGNKAALQLAELAADLVRRD